MKQYLVYNVSPGKSPHCVLVTDTEQEARTRVEDYIAQSADFGWIGQYTYVEVEVPDAEMEPRLVSVGVRATMHVPRNWTDDQIKSHAHTNFRSTNEITIDSLSIDNN